MDETYGLNWYDYSARHYDAGYITTPRPDPHSENYYSWSPYVYVGNNPMKFIDPTGMDWFVNNETGDVIFINGVDTITEDHREEYSLGTANYEHLGADNMFGDNVTWFGNYENILDSDFTLIGKTSEVFMQTKGYEKAERVVVETSSTSIMQIEGNGKKFVKGVNSEVKEINKTYVHANRFGEYKELGERTMQLEPDVDEFVSRHQLTRRPGEQILPKDVGRSIDVIGALNEMRKYIKGWIYQKSQTK